MLRSLSRRVHCHDYFHCHRRIIVSPKGARGYHVQSPLFSSGSGDGVTIHDIKISSDRLPLGSNRPDLIPRLDQDVLESLPPSWSRHLRWALQKDLMLRQDFCLLGPAALSRDRRTLLLLYAALVGREVEYLAISRDTSDSDLKQRKEVTAGKSRYVDQAPVRAAIHGRLLILDGLEKAERNVLPTLNNLLENRELSLDDGSMLVSPEIHDSHIGTTNHHRIHRVHADFRVVALGNLDSVMLDPPLRSRFQARLVDHLDPGEILQALLAATKNNTLSKINSNNMMPDVKEIIVQHAVSKQRSLGALVDAIKYFATSKSNVTIKAALSAHDATDQGFIGASDILLDINHNHTPLQSSPPSPPPPTTTTPAGGFVKTPTCGAIVTLIREGIQNSRVVACVGPKGCGKSAIAAEAARGENVELFSLFKDMTSRDLLLQRGTDELGSTVWNKTPITRAVEKGSWVILDGIDKLNADTLSSLARLFEQGEVDLPDGTRLVARPGFGCIALAHPPSASSWMITPEVAGMFHWIKVQPLPTPELRVVLLALFPSVDRKELEKLVKLRDRLNSAIDSGAADTTDAQESLVLSLRKLKHICRRLERQGSDLARLVNDALMTSLMSDRERSVVSACMNECGIKESKPVCDDDESVLLGLDEELLASCRRTPTNPLLVPNPRFKENAGHAKVLRDLLEAHSVGERALLIMGYQGVGKNRVVDYLLSQLQCEREYIQLHRDTTVQSILSSVTVEGGRLVYGDSPLVRAAIQGRILVVDEADKSPVEVVALLKGLIEDGELALPDGRVLRYDDSSEGVTIHPGFRIWALANPAGYPFHGNDLAKEMADVFSCHTVPALDRWSQERVLASYGPNVSSELIGTIVEIWQDLAAAHQKGILAYPFSVREAISVVRHLDAFPSDGLLRSVENVIAFDRFDGALLNQLISIFARHGVQLQSSRTAADDFIPSEGGISTPRTRASMPKHGRVDPDNTPHVGGNTWAGGSGGSDTAGLGGRGGPYRLDSGHAVHQVSDEMKAEVNEEAHRRSKKMAEESLRKKLDDLSMEEFDWEKYERMRQRVLLQIQQLRVHLKDVKKQKEERVWLKRQSTGELDEARLVDALAGEKDVFRRRGLLLSSPGDPRSIQGGEAMSIKLVADVSASMYRFNGYDGRLNRLMEATFMLMESLRENDRFVLQIVGHNGTRANIPLMTCTTPNDPATQLRILEGMVAHTQYTWAGDSTLEAIELAVREARPGELILVVSDANLSRYRIKPKDVAVLLHRNDIHVHLIFIGGGAEAANLAKAIPNGRAHVCFRSEDLPLLMKNIMSSATK
jgi:von Willebrand factor A domain-containing protein 8